jgi:hypothetical protein
VTKAWGKKKNRSKRATLNLGSALGMMNGMVKQTGYHHRLSNQPPSKMQVFEE